VNYWDRHIGDIIRDTVSLTMLEDGAYNRLLDQYYQTERPLPVDKKMVYRLARATSTSERKAVDFVLETFFRLEADGYHQKRCDTEIERFREKQRKAQASANARWSKSVGSANADANASSSHDATDMRTHSEGNAHQAPVASNQTPNLKPLGESTSVGQPHVRAKPAELSAAMRRNSVDAQPGDPRVIAAAEAGVTIATVEAACAEAKAVKPGQRINAGYVLTIAERWTRDAAAPRPAGSVGRPPQQRTYHDERADVIAQLTGRAPAHKPADEGVIDVDASAATPRRLGA
jgi:uncharacterized protein YdaU (DUF1376 family)